MSAALFEIQKAIYAKLTGDAVLMGKVAGVFDAVPPNQAYPYLVIGDATEVPWDLFGTLGNEITMTMHIWSRYAGFAEALNILAEINRVLNRAALVLTGYNTFVCIYEWSETLRDPDGITRHVPVRYRIIVETLT